MSLIKNLLQKVSEASLSRKDAEIVFDKIMSGDLTDIQIAGLLMAMRTRNESVDEITAAALVMRKKCNRVMAPVGAIDIVGTGGDGKGTLNISTAAALVVAGSGVVVAKHGNRNLSSKSGAADVLTAIGINVMVGPKIVQQAIDKAGIGFMMAPMHHPAMRNVMPVRTELGTRTIFNILGPLTNPAWVRRQLTGAFSPDLLIPMATALQQLGCDHAWLVHGDDGTDELSICGNTKVIELIDGKLTHLTIHPSHAGLDSHDIAEIKGGSPEYNALALKDLLAGSQSAYRDAVLLNSAAALLIAGRTSSLEDGVNIARESLDTGSAQAKADQLSEITNQ